MPGDRIAEVQLQVERHLIVPAAAGVHLATHRADDLGQTPLDGHVDILVRQRPGEGAVEHLSGHPVQSLQDAIALLARQDADVCQHAHVSARAGDVEGRQNVVERDGSIEALEKGCRGGRETAAQGLSLPPLMTGPLTGVLGGCGPILRPAGPTVG